MKNKLHIFKMFVLLLSCVLIFTAASQHTYAFFMTKSNSVVNTFQTPLEDEPENPPEEKPDTPPEDEPAISPDEEPDDSPVAPEDGDYTGPIAPPTGDIY